MKVTYRGPDGAGVIIPNAGEDIVAPFEVEVEVPDELGGRLLDEQRAWWLSPGVDASPPKSASKADWETFRAAQGYDVDGLTKDELIELGDVVAVNEEG